MALSAACVACGATVFCFYFCLVTIKTGWLLKCSIDRAETPNHAPAVLMLRKTDNLSVGLFIFFLDTVMCCQL